MYIHPWQLFFQGKQTIWELNVKPGGNGTNRKEVGNGTNRKEVGNGTDRKEVVNGTNRKEVNKVVTKLEEIVELSASKQRTGDFFNQGCGSGRVLPGSDLT